MGYLSANRSLVSIAIVALMLSTTIVVQTSAATTVSIMQKSITLTAGADGRAFALINDTYSYRATQRVDYNNGFALYAIDYNNLHTPSPGGYLYTGIGPVFESPQPGFDPDPYSTGRLGPNFEVPRFMMMRNTTQNAVSPTINLTANAVTLGFGTTTGFEVDGSNIVLASLRVSAAEQNKLVALTGLLTGSHVDCLVYYPNSTYYNDQGWDAGYFAFPFLANMAGYYAFYFNSSGVAHIEITPKLLDAESLSMGSIATGELALPAVIDLTMYIAVDPAPSEIKAVSCSVSAGDEFTVSFSMLEHLVSGSSNVECWYFDGTRKYEDGMPVFAPLTSGSSTTVRAGLSGNVYIVLVGDVLSRITYAMGFMPTVIPTAPLNVPFLVDLPLPGGATSQQYKFIVTEDSMVRFNCSSPSGTIDATIVRIKPDGTFYTSTDSDIDSGTGPFIVGPAEGSASIDDALYMPAGTYELKFSVSVSGSAWVEINTYPIVGYTSGSALDVTAHTTKALNISILNPLEYYAFNVSLISSQLNASILYQLSLFGYYDRYLGSIIRDGSASGLAGLGNKKQSGGWLNVSSYNYYVDPETPTTRRWFSGNKTLQECLFVPTYAGKYFLILDCLNTYDTSTSGQTSGAARWRNYTAAVTLKIDLSKPDYADIAGGVYEIVYTTLDSSSGTGSTSVSFTSTGSPTLRMIGLKLTPQVDTWTRITVTIINGTSGATTNLTSRNSNRYEKLFDVIRWGAGTNTLNPDNTGPQFWPWLTYYMVHGVTRQNATYIIEFGALQHEMMIRFLVDLYASGTAAHTVVSFSVSHYSTPGFSGLVLPTGPGVVAAAPFPWEIVLIVSVIVAVVLVVIFIVVKKKKKPTA